MVDVVVLDPGSPQVVVVNGEQGVHIVEVAARPDTAAQVLAKLLAVDGAGSGLDADMLDGHSSGYFEVAGAAASALASAMAYTDAAKAFAIQRANHTGTQAWSTITGTPTTKAGYGITDVPSGSGTSTGTNTGDQTSVTGNAGTATALQTARAINGVNFDGTTPITIAAAAGTLTGSTLAAGVTASSLTSVGALTGGSTGVGFTVALSSSTITGTLADARLSANVPLLNAANAFALGPNTFSAGGAANKALVIKGTTASAAVSNKALTSNVATLTTSSAHGFIAGHSVVITGVDATFNGTFPIIATPSGTTFTYAKTAADVGSTAATGTTVGDIQTGDIFQVQDGNALSLHGVYPSGISYFRAVNGVAGTNEIQIAPTLTNGLISLKSGNLAIGASSIGFGDLNGSSRRMYFDLNTGQTLGNGMLFGFDSSATANGTYDGVFYKVASGNIGIAGNAAGKLGQLTASTVLLNALSTPALTSVTTSGTSGATSYGYKITKVDASGKESIASATVTVATGNAALSGANFNVLTVPAIPSDTTKYNVYRVASGGTPSSTGLVGSITSGTTFNDTGFAGDSSAAPTANTTGMLTAAFVKLPGNSTCDTPTASNPFAALRAVFGSSNQGVLIEGSGPGIVRAQNGGGLQLGGSNSTTADNVVNMFCMTSASITWGGDTGFSRSAAGTIQQANLTTALGGAIHQFAGLSSTSTSRLQSELRSSWSDSTDATRAGDLAIGAYNVATFQEGFRVRADPTSVKIGFYGATPIAKQTLPSAGTVTVADIRTALIALGLCQ